MIAPVALFVYNRPEHTAKVLEQLRKNFLASETTVFVFGDGPKAGASPDDHDKIKSVRDVVKSATGFREIKSFFSNENRGIGRSMISGISQVLSEHDRIIVLEDDILTAPNFLNFCNQSLDKYSDDENVIHISGFMYPLESILPDTFFLPSVACWGWATWARAWKFYEADTSILLEKIDAAGKEDSFDLGKTYPYYELLQRQLNCNESNFDWDIHWYASVFLKNGISLYPGKSLASNIGMDGSGTHWKQSEDFKVDLDESNVDKKFSFPEMPEVDARITEEVKKYFGSLSNPGLAKKIIRRFRDSWNYRVSRKED